MNTYQRVATQVVVTIGLIMSLLGVPHTPQAQTAQAVTIPAVVTRFGNNHVVQPTQWCLDHKALCIDTLKDRFVREWNTDPSNLPPDHALANLKRTYINTYNAVTAKLPPAKRQRALTALEAYNHYKDGVDGPGTHPCHLMFDAADMTPGAPAYPVCARDTWGGADGLDPSGLINFDNIDKGFIVCEGVVLAVSGGETVLTGGVGAPVGLSTAEVGTLRCGVGYLLSKWLF